MSVVGIGVDVVDVSRMEQTLERYGTRTFRHVFTSEEIEESSRHREAARYFAERFAVKEAAFKALGTGWSGAISWHDVRVVDGRAVLALAGEAARVAAERGATESHVSFSSRASLAFALVVLSSP